MTAAHQRLHRARLALGLSLSEMADRLQLRGTQAKDDLRKMEEGVRPVTGPVLVAAEALVKLEHPDFADLMEEVADTPTTEETPGVAADVLGDQIVALARQWMKLNGGARA
jgi:transcriptional regulator with XRE-family HTH domain